MNRYTFPVILAGVGNTPDEAWMDAVEQFGNDPGSPEIASNVEPLDPEDE